MYRDQIVRYHSEAWHRLLAFKIYNLNEGWITWSVENGWALMKWTKF